MNSAEYELAYAAVTEATNKFIAIRLLYRSRQIGDVEFLNAREEYEKAQLAFDIAYAKMRVVDEYQRALINHFTESEPRS